MLAAQFAQRLDAGMPLWLLVPILAATFIGLRYLVLAGGALGLLTLFSERLKRFRIQARPFNSKQLRHELAYSSLSILVFALLAGIGIALRGEPSTGAVYFNVADFGWVWLIASVPIALLLHDAYFYWAHRLLHVPGIFERVHRVHHVSTNPSPLASFAFHPLEAVVNAFGVVLIVACLPMHPIALAVFGSLAFGMNVLGHCGHEFFPATLRTSAFGRWINTATSHNLHHRAFNANYGLYTLIWDRLCGTIHSNYGK